MYLLDQAKYHLCNCEQSEPLDTILVFDPKMRPKPRPQLMQQLVIRMLAIISLVNKTHLGHKSLVLLIREPISIHWNQQIKFFLKFLESQLLIMLALHLLPPFNSLEKLVLVLEHFLPLLVG